MKKKVIISTETFPYGKGEKTFIMSELEQLMEVYNVTIVSHAPVEIVEDLENKTVLGPSVEIINIPIMLSFGRRIAYALHYLADIDGWREIVSIFRERKRILCRIYQSIGFYALALENYRLMKKAKVFDEEIPTIYYTFWYFYYTYSMTRNIKKHNNIKIITRTHGFDLYNERYTGGRQPFKRIMDENLDKVVFISETGKKYYQNVYGCSLEDKYAVNYLGVKQQNANAVIKSKGEPFRIVSCSSIIPLKRVELIIQALSELQEEIVEWVHFGDGVEYARIQRMAAELLRCKANITYELKGFVCNADILDYYHSHKIDCFITTSLTEGIPISIQEAMSMRIPIIATNVGGIHEMIDGNGILMSANPQIDEVSKAICAIYHMNDIDLDWMGQRSYEIWDEKFNVNKNVEEFISILKEI